MSFVHFMYVDESGDPGTVPDKATPGYRMPSSHYALSGLIIADSDWRNYLSIMVEIRRQMKVTYGLPMRAELHASELIRPSSGTVLAAVGPKHRRIALYRDMLTSMATRLNSARVISINLNKLKPKYASTPSRGIEEWAWEALLQRFQTFLVKSCSNDYGIVVSDQANEKKIRGLLRRMRHHSQVSSMYGGPPLSRPVTNILEDPVMRNSQDSYFIQAADLIVHALYRKRYPKGSLRRHRVEQLYNILEPICQKSACYTDPDKLGIKDL